MIVVDIETSGIDPQANSILSIGAVDLDKPDRRYYGECRLRPGAAFSAEALGVNGFTEEQIRDEAKPSEQELLSQFIAWLSEGPDQILAGQNVHFDWAFLQAAADRYQLAYRFDYHLVDLHSLCFAHQLARGLTPPRHDGVSALNTDIIHPYCGLPTEPRPHNALNGALYEAESFSRLIFGQPLLPQFEAYPIPF